MPSTRFEPIRRVPLITALAMLIASGSIAAEEPALKEIKVTATQREADVRDVPYSIQVIGAEELDAYQIQDLNELSQRVANFSVGFGGGTQMITMRGMGAGPERSLQQSVALFIDDLYRPRSRQYRAPLLDTERVEVVRGPQSVINNFNATAGAVNIVTRRTLPGDPFSAELSADYEFEYGGPGFTAVVGGSPLDTLGLRAAIKYRDRDGFFENAFTGADENDSRDILMRVSAVWTPTDRLTVTAKYEPADYEVHGNVGEAYGPGAALLEPGDGRLDWRRAADASLIDPFELFRESGPATTSRIKIITARVDYLLGKGTFSALVSHSQFDFELSTDLDASALRILGGGQEEDYEIDALELRYASPTGGALDYLAGASFHNTDLESDQIELVGPERIAPATALEATTVFELDATLQVLYGQATWHLGERLHLTGGLRLNKDRREVLRGSDCKVGPLSGPLLPASPELIAEYCPNPGLNGYEAKRKKDHLLPELAARWEARDDLMVYAKVGTGAKFGGFSTLSDATPEDLEYDDEEVTGFELGFKSRLAGGAAELNLALFLNDYKDLQVASLLPFELNEIFPPRSTIDNAATATTQGLELDGRWAVSESLSLGAAVAWLDAEYDAYPQAPCNSVNIQSNPGGRCDLSGQPLPFAADFSGSLWADYSRPLTPGLNLSAGVNLAFSDAYFTESALDPNARQDSWTNLSARIGVEDSGGVWRVELVGKNLMNEKILGSSQAFGDYFIGYLEPPRMVLLQGTYRIGRQRR